MSKQTQNSTGADVGLVGILRRIQAECQTKSVHDLIEDALRLATPPSADQPDDGFIVTAVRHGRVKGVHPDAPNTIDIGRAVLDAYLRSMALPGAAERTPTTWPNGCDRTIPRALRYLAEHDRPGGGEQHFNSAHLYQLADEMERAVEAAASNSLTEQPAPPGTLLLDEIRAAGWAVGVHNDYRLNGVPHTFWLFTKGDLNAKGEGLSDQEALAQVRKQIAVVESRYSSKTVGQG